jgi:hypothetical protein
VADSPAGETATEAPGDLIVYAAADRISAERLAAELSHTRGTGPSSPPLPTSFYPHSSLAVLFIFLLPVFWSN